MKVIDFFVSSLPQRPYHSENPKIFGLRYDDREIAMAAPYVQLHRVRRSWLAFDIDREGAAFAHEEASFPGPTLTVVNPKNHHAHLLYGLEQPVWGPDRNGRGSFSRKALNLLELVQSAFERRLGADLGFTGMICKNPFHPKWDLLVWDRLFDLRELAEYLRPDELRHRRSKHEIEEVGPIEKGRRNDMVFRLARKAVYPRVRECRSHTELLNLAIAECMTVNARCIPRLAEREIISIAHSIAKWTWQRRERFINPPRGNRGALGLDPIPWEMDEAEKTIEVKSRQSAGAEHTNKIRRESTEGRIIEAIDKLRTEGRKVTKMAVSALVGISDRALRKGYSHLFDEPKNRNSAASQIGWRSFRRIFQHRPLALKTKISGLPLVSIKLPLKNGPHHDRN